MSETPICRLSSRSPGARRRAQYAFTLIELLVVLAIVGLLLSIAAPRYFASVERARENTLRTSLNVMRDAIDKYLGDQGHYPRRSQRARCAPLPAQRARGIPWTSSAETWVTAPPPPDSLDTNGIADVHSGASGQASDGTVYADW